MERLPPPLSHTHLPLLLSFPVPLVSLKPLRPGGEKRKSAHQLHERVVAQVDGFNRCVGAYQRRLLGDYPSLMTELYGISAQDAAAASTSTSSLDPLQQYKQHLPVWFRAAQMSVSQFLLL